MTKKLNIGVIGCGFMGRVHSNAYLKLNKFFDVGHEMVMKCICDSNAKKVKTFADNWGWETTETDWRKMMKRDDIDVIDVCTPNNTHHDIVIAAAKAGKIVALEKPLSMDAEEGVSMVEAIEKSGKPNMVWRADLRLALRQPSRVRTSFPLGVLGLRAGQHVGEDRFVLGNPGIKLRLE